jgi:hypothetical protein
VQPTTEPEIARRRFDDHIDLVTRFASTALHASLAARRCRRLLDVRRLREARLEIRFLRAALRELKGMPSDRKECVEERERLCATEVILAARLQRELGAFGR